MLFSCEVASTNDCLQIHLIALDFPYDGTVLTNNVTGIRAADLACYLASRRAGYQMTFRALLSATVQVSTFICNFFY